MGAVISLAAYFAGMYLKKKWNRSFLNPLLISIVITIIFVIVCRIDYDTYYEGAKYISYLLTRLLFALQFRFMSNFRFSKATGKQSLPA